MAQSPKKLKFIVSSTYGEILDLAMRLQDEGHKVLLNIGDHDYERIGEGLIPKIKDWHRALGKGFVWVFDGCESGDLQDWLRDGGELVFGGSKSGDYLENNRQAGQAWFKKIGFRQPESQNFTDIESAQKFVQEHLDRRWILKQNGNAPKSINYMAKFEGNVDLLHHLEELKLKWNEHDFGKFDCDLMEIVEGTEIACSAIFNGTDFMKDEKGNVVAWINFEHKKETDGDGGETTGELGTLFYGTDSTNKTVQKILMHEEIIRVLRKSKFRGVFDINGCLLKDGTFCAFEPTCRFGVPSTSYELIESMQSNLGEVIHSVALGEQMPIKITRGWGMVMVIAAKPFPVEMDVADGATSINEKLWILKDGKPVKDFDEEQKKHIHLENFSKDDGEYRVATKNGYLLTVTASGKDIKSIREGLIKYIKDNIYLAGMKFRHDIGKRIEESKSLKK